MTEADNTSDTSHKTIASALAAAQSEMGRAKKSANNPHFKSKYADLDAVCDAALPALNKHGIAVVQPLAPSGDGWVVITRFIHGDSGDTMEGPVPLLIGKNDMQGLGSAITYARRYGLMCLSGIAPEDDDGNLAAKNAPPAFNARATADRLISAISRKNGDRSDLEMLWSDEKEALAKLPDPIFAEVKAEFRKAASSNPLPADDLGNDTIPY